MSQEVPQSVKKCITTINSAKNDTEKFAALFMVAKLLKGNDCNTYCKKLLFESIGVSFLKRLLLCSDVPVGCPSQVYKSVAISVLSAFCREQEIATHSQILSNITIFLDIVQQADADDYEDNLMVINETYECLVSVAVYEMGKKALFDIGAVSKLSQIYSQQSFQTDEALNILVTLVERFGPKAWGNDVDSFNALMNVLSLDFETDTSDRKYKICPILRSFLRNSPLDLLEENEASNDDSSWQSSILKGVNDILSSKAVKSQRDPALMLASQMIITFGVEWTLLEDENNPKQLFLLLIQLSSVEVRMQLDKQQNLKLLMKNASLVSACFSILERCISFIAVDSLDLEQKEKQHVYTALKGAFSTVISALNVFARSKESLKDDEKMLTYSMIRAFGGWLAQETSALRNEVYALMPFILTLANESFYNYRSKHVSERVKKQSSNGVQEEDKDADTNHDRLADVNLLRILLPALCHVVVQDKGREIFLKEHEEEILLECLTFYWSIVHYKKPPIPKAERKKLAAAGGKVEEPKLTQKALNELNDARAAVVSICNTFMNITVLETKLVDESTLFSSLSKFVFDNLPELKNVEDNLLVYGNMAVLGLLLLKQQSKRVKKDDFTICRYIQSTIRFLWDAYCVEESNDESALVVSMSYKKYWMELMELWFLGMQTLSSILSLIPWISDFAIESGWVQGIMEMLKQARVGTLPANTKCAYEDFLCHLIDANRDVKRVLKENNALSTCRNHRLMEVGKRLFGD